MEGQALPAVAACDVDHEAQVGRDHPVLRLEVAALDALGELDLLSGSEQRVLRGLLEEQLQRLEIARLLLALLALLRGRLVQALDVTALRSPAATDAAPETMLLLGVVVRSYSSRFRDRSEAAVPPPRLPLVRPVKVS